MSDLEIAYKAIEAKQASYNLLWDYYDGNHPLVYSTERLEEVFRRLNVSFVENWCGLVVDAVLERVQLTRFEVGDDDEATARLNQLFEATELSLDSDDAHLAALVTGESFIIAWAEDRDIQAYYNDPRLCHMQYDSENPHKKSWAAKWWGSEDDVHHITLYYPEELQYYKTARAGSVSSVNAFVPDDPPSAPNPYGEIPVFHLRRERRAIRSELTNSILTLQVAVNKLLADMMVAGEFGAFPQRYIISQADTAALKNAPNEIWEIPAGDGLGQAASVGQLAAASLSNYSGALENLAAAISTLSRTPMHYFFGQKGAPSGEALIAMEAPLNKKCSRYIKRFGITWQRLAAFLLLLDGREVDPTRIAATWQDPETVQPKTRAEIRESSVRAGVPLTTALRDEGWSDAEIEQMYQDKAEEVAESQAGLAQALLEQERSFDQM